MKTYHKIICIIAGLLVSATLSVAEVDPNTPHFQRPQEKYGSLFGHILMNDSLFGPNCYFADSKDFLDRIPSSDLTGIAKDFDALKPKTTASISRFLTVNFHLQPLPADTFKDTSDIDTHIRKLYDFSDSKSIFALADISGGICYFLYDFNYDGPCDVYKKLCRSHR